MRLYAWPDWKKADVNRLDIVNYVFTDSLLYVDYGPWWIGVIIREWETFFFGLLGVFLCILDSSIFIPRMKI